MSMYYKNVKRKGSVIFLKYFYEGTFFAKCGGGEYFSRLQSLEHIHTFFMKEIQMWNPKKKSNVLQYYTIQCQIRLKAGQNKVFVYYFLSKMDEIWIFHFEVHECSYSSENILFTKIEQRVRKKKCPICNLTDLPFSNLGC